MSRGKGKPDVENQLCKEARNSRLDMEVDQHRNELNDRPRSKTESPELTVEESNGTNKRKNEISSKMKEVRLWKY